MPFLFTHRYLLAWAMLLVLSADRHALADSPPPPVPLSENDAKELEISFVTSYTEAESGFIIAGKNSSEVIRDLKSLNQRPIAALEKEMRPGASSDSGFLGEAESLLEVLVADNDTVTQKLKLSHAQLAKPLLVIGYYAAQHAGAKPIAVSYGKEDFQVYSSLSRGFQDSPFDDGTKTNATILITNLRTGQKLNYSLLVPHMIERYGFYEGKGTPYRVDPLKIAQVLGLTPEEAKPAR